MKGVRLGHAMLSASLIASSACGDVLGLHDLVEDADGGPRGGLADPGVPDAGDGGEPAAASPTPLEGPAVGSPVDASGGVSESEPDTGAISAPETAGHEGDGGPPAGQDAAAVADGAGACSDCGPPACSVTHSNGVGQTFMDCVPLGTHDETQARSACEAFAGRASSCTPQACPQDNNDGSGKGSAKDDQAVCSTGASTCECWTFAGSDVGLVKAASPDKCEPCSKGGAAWN